MSDRVRIRTYKSGTKCEHCKHVEPEYWVASFATDHNNGYQTAVGRTRRAAIRHLLAALKRGAK